MVSILRRGSFFQDVSFTAVSQLVVMLIALLLNKVISSYLNPADFAIFSIANRTASVMAFIMLLGLGIAMPRYLAIARAKKNSEQERGLFYAACVLILSASVIVFVISMLFADQLTDIIFSDMQYKSLILPTLFFALSITISNFVYSYYRGVDKFKSYNMLQIVLQSLNLLIATIAGANIANQLMSRGVITGLLSVCVIAFIILLTYRRQGVPRKVLSENTKDLLAYCTPRIPGEILLFSYTVAPLIIINMKFGLHETAAFATVLTLNATVTPLFQFVGMVLLPYVSKNLVRGNVKDIRQKVKKLRLLYLGIGILSVIVMYVFTEFIISLLFSKEYSQFAPIVRITYLSVIPYSLYLLLRNPIDAISKIPFNTLNLAVGFSLLIGGVILAPSTYAAAIAFPMSYLVLGVLSEITWKRLLDKVDRAPNTINSQPREKEA